MCLLVLVCIVLNILQRVEQWRENSVHLIFSIYEWASGLWHAKGLMMLHYVLIPSEPQASCVLVLSGPALWCLSDSCWNLVCYTEHHYRVWMQMVHREMCWLLCLRWQGIAWLFTCCTCYLSKTCLFSCYQQIHLIYVNIGNEGSLDILEDISWFLL